MKLGIGSYTYTWAVGVPGYELEQPLGALDLLLKAESLGVGVVQIADNLPLDALTERALRGVEREARARDVQIEVGTRGIQPDHLANYLELAQRFGSPILRVVIDTLEYQPTVTEVIDLISESLPAFKEANVCLALENHDRFSVSEYKRILEEVDSPYLGICLDTVNSFGALERPQTVVEALASWTVNLHIKDFNIHRADHMMGFIIEGTPAGQGRLDIPMLLGKLKEDGRRLNVILELWTPPEKNIADTIAKEADWAEKSIAYLREFILD